MPLPSVSQLRQALKIAEKLEAMEAELAGLMGGSTKAAKRGRPLGKPQKNGMSEEGRKRIAEAQKKRWAAKKKADGKK
jgi:hypothetical protein